MVANCTLMHPLVHLHCGCNAQKRRTRNILHLSPAPVRFRCHTGCRQKKPANRSTRCICEAQTQAQRSNVSNPTRYTCYWLQMIVVWSARAEGGDENRRSACSCPLLCDSATFPSQTNTVAYVGALAATLRATRDACPSERSVEMMAVTTAARWSITSGRPVSCEDGPAAARKQQTSSDPPVVGCRRGRPPGLIPPPVPTTRALDHGRHTAKAWSRCIRGVDLAAVHNHDGV